METKPQAGSPETLTEPKKMEPQLHEKTHSAFVEYAGDNSSNLNLTYDDDEEEPELHFRTWIAIIAMFALNLVQVFALLGPPAVVSTLVRSSSHQGIRSHRIHSFHSSEPVLTIQRRRTGSRTHSLSFKLYWGPSFRPPQTFSKPAKQYWLHRHSSLSLAQR